MKNYFMGSLTLVLLLVGCGSDGGSCCSGDSDELLATKGEELQPKLPTAVINRDIVSDVSVSQSESQDDVGGDVFQVPQSNIINEYTITFDCKNSFDNDAFDTNENNQSIERCDWNITRPDNCPGMSLFSGESVALNCTDTPDINDTVFVKLTVIDNENQTNETNTTVIY